MAFVLCARGTLPALQGAREAALFTSLGLHVHLSGCWGGAGKRVVLLPVVRVTAQRPRDKAVEGHGLRLPVAVDGSVWLGDVSAAVGGALVVWGRCRVGRRVSEGVCGLCLTALLEEQEEEERLRRWVCV